MLAVNVIMSFREVPRGMPLSFITISVHFNIFINSLNENSKNVENEGAVTTVYKRCETDNHKFPIGQRCDEGDKP